MRASLFIVWLPPLLPGLAARWSRFSCYLFPLFLYFVFCNPVPRSHAPGPLLFIPSAESSLTIPIVSRPDGGAPTGKTVIATTDSATLPAATKEVERLGHLQSPSDSALADHPSFGQQMVQKATAAIVILSSLIAYVTVNSAVRAVNPRAFVWSAEDNDEKHWIASSPSWLDRKACRWLGLCGTAHFHPAGRRFGQRGPPLADEEDDTEPWRSYWWNETDAVDETWDEAEHSRRLIPDYVFRYAPLVHLFSDEQFWPGDIAEHLYHVTPTLNYTPIQSQEQHPSLEDLNELNQWQDGRPVFLTSNDNVEDRPPWMEGEKNIPRSPDGHVEQSWADWDGRVDGGHPDDTPEERAKWYDAAQLPADEDLDRISPDALGYPQPEDILNFKDDEIVRDELRKRYGGEPIHAETSKGRSDAPAILLVMDKGNGIIDAFWFFFYSFNLGNVVLNVRFGNHIGDWEHCLVRFHHGKPKALFFSAHSAGEAYSYEAVEKIGERVSLFPPPTRVTFGKC